MPANPIASAVALEAILTPAAPAAPPAAASVTQTFNSLLGNLIDDAGPSATAQPPSIKKQPTDQDAYTAQMMTNQVPAQPAPPVLIPAAVLRMHFYFPATPSAKHSDAQTDDVNDESNLTPNALTTTQTLTPVTLLPPQPPAAPSPQPAPVQIASALQPAAQTSTIQTSTLPTPAQPIADLQSATQQVSTPQPVPAAPAPVPVTTKRTTRSADPADDTPQTAASSPNPALLIPMPQLPAPQSSAPQPPPSHAAPESQIRTSGPVAQTSAASAPARTIQNSPKENLNLSSKDSPTPQFSVNPEGTAPLPHAELAFAAKLTVTAPSQLQPEHLQPTPSPMNSLTAAPKTAAPTPSPATPSPSAPAIQPVPADQRADTNNGDAPSPDPQPQGKASAKVQVESRPLVTEAPAVQKPDSLPPSPASTLPAIPIPPVAESNISPAAVKTATEPHSQPIDSRPDAAALPQTNTSTKAEPVRDLSIRIGDNPGNQVDVKIQERSGEVHVSVLSNSPAMTTDLRQQVGDLVGKLDRAGYHAETFKPGSPTASQQASNQSDQNQQQSSAGGRQQQQQDEARQQFLGRQKKSNQSQWLQQMNGNFGPAVEGIENQ